jgi:hypothetical protein
MGLVATLTSVTLSTPAIAPNTSVIAEEMLERVFADEGEVNVRL